MNRTPNPAFAASLSLLACAAASLAQGEQPAPGAPTPASTAPERPTTAPTRASIAAPRDEPEGDATGVRFRIGVGGSHAFDSDFDSAGSASVSRAALELRIDAPLSDSASLSFAFDTEASFYDFDGATALIPGTGDPWDDLYSMSLGPTFTFRVDEQWSWFVGADIRFSGEAEADIGDSITFGGVAGARYAFSKNFALTFGAFGTSRLEDDPLILPLIGVEWQINDTVRLATRGTGLAITAALSDTLEFSILGAWNSRDYRLEDGRAFNPEGVVRDTRVPIGVELAWSPDKAVRLSLLGGVVAWQEYETFDANGNDIADDTTDPAAYVGLSAAFRF